MEGCLERATATRITGRRSKGGWRGEAFIRVISYLYWDSYCGYFGEIVLQRGTTARGGALIYEQSRPFRATEITAAGNGSYNRHSECLNKVGRNDRLCNTVTNRPSFDSMCVHPPPPPKICATYHTIISNVNLFSSYRRRTMMRCWCYRSVVLVWTYIYIYGKSMPFPVAKTRIRNI